MNVFLTGGTGLLGNNILKELENRNFNVTALVRSIERAGKIIDPSIDLVEGDLNDVSGFKEKLVNNEVLIHSAAYYTDYYKEGDSKKTFSINVQSTLNLIKSAYQKGIRKIIYISSTGVLQHSTVHATDESSLYDETNPDAYFQSKIKAEKELYKLQKDLNDLEIIYILPTAMIGPNDIGPTPSNNFILNFLKGKVKMILPGSLKIVDARDVAIAVVNSINLGKNGERYIIGGSKHSISEIINTLKSITGISKPDKEISFNKILFISNVMKIIAKITSKQPELKPSIIKRLNENFWYDSSKASRELNISFRPIGLTLADTVSWMKNYYGV
jgi:dihydroflavonol-4-reductase